MFKNLILVLTLDSFQHPWPGYLFGVAFGFGDLMGKSFLALRFMQKDDWLF